VKQHGINYFKEPKILSSKKNNPMKIFNTFLFIFLALQMNAQRFSWGVPVKHDKLEFDGGAITKRHLLREDKDGMIRLRVQKKDVIANSEIIIEHYGANLELTKTILVLESNKIYDIFEEIVIDKDKIHVFLSKTGTDKTNTLKVQTFDFDGEMIGSMQTLDVIKGIKAIDIGNFYIAASENKQHFAILSEPPFDKDANESFMVKTFDADFKETFGQTMTLEYPSKRSLWNSPYIMNDGTMFISKYQKIQKVGVVRDMYVLDRAGKKLNSTKVTLSGGFDFCNIDNEMLETKDGHFIYAGLYKEDGALKLPLGVSYVEFDNTGKIVREVVKPYKDVPKLGVSNLVLKDVELLDNGDVLFLAHQSSSSSVSVGTDVNNRVYSYKGESIYVARLSGDNLVWSQVIERKLIESQSDNGRLLDFAWMYDKEGDNLIILYNDMQDRYQTALRGANYKIPMLAYIAKDGLYSTKPLLTVGLGKYEDSYTFCPDEAYRVGNYLVVKCTNNIDFKMGRFSL
jgi:hypothetical protein